MPFTRRKCSLGLIAVGVLGCRGTASVTPGAAPFITVAFDAFTGSKAGDEREIAGIKFCWCPPGRFTMGSPRNEPERRPGEDQVEVMLSKGFWTGKYEVTQSQWKRVVGEFPGKYTAGEGDAFPVYDIDFAAMEDFCRRLTENARASGDLPKEWEFRLPTEAHGNTRAGPEPRLPPRSATS